ncbi:MAG: tail fiber domain-containing protein [Dysgonamonadaceae bacterium]|jgi:hypothetical protein|nr:tail fiber domain-containing protein [Dysgonamonadaceae bacterium]
MKKTIFILSICFAFAQFTFAQLKVNSLGQVGIGTTPQYDKLEVAGNIYLKNASNFLGTTAGNIPVTFKVNNILAGTTGSSTNSNVSFGYMALHNPNGNSNTATGYYALYANNFGNGNTATGYYALYSNINANNNTANGISALYSNTSGDSNTATGYFSLYENTTGDDNTAAGFYALNHNITGNNNTANGTGALYDNETGNNNTAIGYCANVNAGNLNNVSVIGFAATVTASNQVRIGNSSVTSIGGYANWTNLSDGRVKKNIQTNVPGLAFINRLQPITYNLNLNVLDELQKSDDPKINARRDSLDNTLSPETKEIIAKAKADKEKIIYSGFIAQDVEKTAKSVGYDFNGVDAPENGKGTYGLRYAEFVVPLVKAVQELSEQNTRMQAQIDELLQEKGTLRSENATETATGLQNVANGGASLQQNTPNPFSQNTQIKYYLPATIKTAYLCIYDLQGAQLKQTAIPERGEGAYTLYGSELKAGIYLYSLIADGQEVDTKRMILTK